MVMTTRPTYMSIIITIIIIILSHKTPTSERKLLHPSSLHLCLSHARTHALSHRNIYNNISIIYSAMQCYGFLPSNSPEFLYSTRHALSFFCFCFFVPTLLLAYGVCFDNFVDMPITHQLSLLNGFDYCLRLLLFSYVFNVFIYPVVALLSSVSIFSYVPTSRYSPRLLYKFS